MDSVTVRKGKMMRPIDADALEEELVSHKYKHSPYLHFLDVAVAIERMPTIDAVPVVRCKDCIGWIDHVCSNTACITNSDDYCSCGERRGDE